MVVGEGHGQRVGGVGRLGAGREAELALHGGLDLLLAGMAEPVSVPLTRLGR